MPDAFFSSSKSKKRKISSSAPTSSKVKLRQKGNAPPKKKRKDEELESQGTAASGDEGFFDNTDLRASDVDPGESGDEYENETPAEKRLRLAKLYIESVRQDLGDGDYDAAEIDKELIEARLQKDVLEHSGKVHLYVAESINTHMDSARSLRLRGHRLPLTSAVISDDGRKLFSSSKDGSIIKWDILAGTRQATFPKLPGKSKGKQKAQEVHEGHTDEVLALALSTDQKYLVSGGKDRKVVVWDAQEGKWLKSFTGHRDTISALSFRKGSLQVFSASYDRTIKIFDLAAMGYVETLFGHQDVIVDLDCLRAETALSVGARDKSVRFWKVVDESQLVFRGGGKSAMRELLEGGLLDADADGDAKMDGLTVVDGMDFGINGTSSTTSPLLKKSKITQENAQVKPKAKALKFAEGSIDCVAMIDETLFLSGGDSGSICLWTTTKKKPIFTQQLAHGLHETLSETEGMLFTPRWITSLATLRYSDFFASGSWDGAIRLWQLHSGLKSFSALSTIQAPGFVNSLNVISIAAGTLQDATWIKRPSPSSSSPSAAHADVDERLDAEPTTGDASVVVNIPRTKPTKHVLIVAALGQEPRLGRWMRIAGEGTRSRNQALVVAVPFMD